MLCQPGNMSDANGSWLFRKRRVRQYARHGYAYSWLRAHYSQVAAALKSGEQSWPSVAEAMTRDGVRSRSGGKLTPNAAVKVWRRVSRDVETAAATNAAAVPKRKYPSRMSADWRPGVVPAPAPPPSLPPPPPPSPPRPSSASAPIAGRFMDPEGLPPEAQQMLAELEEQFRRADRYLGPRPTGKGNNG
jgi:hypothetical protein